MSVGPKLTEFLKSLNLRVFALIAAAGIIPAVIVCISMVRVYTSGAVSVRESTILSQAKILTVQLATKDRLDIESVLAQEIRINQLSGIYSGRILVIDNTFRIIKDTYNIDTGKIIISDEVSGSIKGDEIVRYDDVNRFIQVTVPVLNPDNSDIIGVLLVSVSTDEIHKNRQNMINNVMLSMLILSVFVLIFAAFGAVGVSRPFKRLASRIEQVHVGIEDELIPESSFTETEDISHRVTSLLRRMKIMDESRQEFVSNVSHELKTPLTSMKVLADSLTGQEGVPLELYQEFMKDIASEIDRENRIITDLLTLVKLDNKTMPDLNIEQTNINSILELTMKRMEPIASQAGVELVLESFRPVMADADALKLGQAFTNLIENAIKYNDKENGYVHVSLNADHQYFYVKVEDNGMGIPEESLDHIYERFYRVDKSHSGEIGGTGLGLAIAKSVIALHRGVIKVHSALDDGTTFSVRIPLIYQKG